jgi:predicted lipid-binding transport protein (Tim44 family)
MQRRASEGKVFLVALFLKGRKDHNIYPIECIGAQTWEEEMVRGGKGVKFLGLVAVLFSFLLVTELDCFARAGGGRSYGSRGSRPLSPPTKSYTAPSPSQPSKQQRGYVPPPGQPVPPPSPFWHGLAGGLLGGIIGGMLFRGLGFAGPGVGWGGPGLLDILLMAALLYGVYWFMVKRRRLAEARDHYHAYYGNPPPKEPLGVEVWDLQDESPRDEELLRGLEHIAQMDPMFSLESFLEEAKDTFFKVQAAWSKRDMGPVREKLTEEMFRILQSQLDEMRSQGRINRLENLALRSVEPIEAWQEAGQDFITLKIEASLLDYYVDESGRLISGSDTEPVKFQEYWTFTRPVGPNRWRLSAISQG